MKTFRSLASWLLCLVLAAGLLPAGAAGAYTPGTYSKTIPGHNAPMTIKVTFLRIKSPTSTPKKTWRPSAWAPWRLKSCLRKSSPPSPLGWTPSPAPRSPASPSWPPSRTASSRRAGGDVDALGKVEVKKAEVLPEYSADVVVVGAGGAGLAAAISAAQQGASVVVVEKLGIVGGSTNVSEGALNAVDEKRQSAQGIEDSVEKFYQQTMEGGHNAGTPSWSNT